MWDLTQQPLSVTCPVTIIHGTKDTSVPYEESLKLKNLIESEAGEPEIVTVEDGSHRYEIRIYS